MQDHTSYFIVVIYCLTFYWFYRKLGIPPDKTDTPPHRPRRGKPPAIGWRDEVLPNKTTKPNTESNIHVGFRRDLLDNRQYSENNNSNDRDGYTIENTNSSPSRVNLNARQGSKSLPASPAKRKNIYSNVNYGNTVTPHSLAIQRSKSVPESEKQRTDIKPARFKLSHDRKPSSDHKTKYKDGHYYIAVASADDTPMKVEKETVL